MANEFKIKNGLVVSGSADIEQDLTVHGTITAEQFNVSIVSSSIMFESGSTKFGDTSDDNHSFTGSLQITGSISLNGQAIGTGKLDETTFNSFTSSYDTTSGSFNTRIETLELFSSSIDGNYVRDNEFETYSGSINSFTSSIDGRVDELEIESGTIRSNFNSFTSSYTNVSSSLDERIGDLESFSSSLDVSFVSETEFGTYTSSINDRLDDLETESGSIRGDFNLFTSSYTNVSTSIDSRLDTLETLSGSFTGSFSGSFNGDGTNLFNIPASGVTGLNLTQIADGSVTASVSNTNGLRVNSKTEITGSLIVTDGITGSIDYTNITNKPTLISGSVQIDITSTTGYSTFSSSVSSSIGGLSSSVATTTNDLDGRLDNVETSTGSLNSFTSSINTTIKDKLNTEGVISGSVQVTISDTTGFSTFSSSVSSSIGSLSSSIATTTNDLDGRVDSIETSTGSLNSFTSSINATIKDKLNTEGVVSGSIQVSITGTTGFSEFSSSISSSVTTIFVDNFEQDGRLDAIETSTGSLNSFTSSINTTIKNKLNTEGVISGSVQVNLPDVTGYSTFSSSISSSIGSLSSSVATTTNDLDGRLDGVETSTGSLNSFTSSINTTIKNKLNTEGVISGSVQVNLPDVTGYSTFSSSVSSSIGLLSSSVAITDNTQNGRLSSLETESGSVRGDFNSYTSSNDSTNTTQNGRLTSLEGKSGSYATTGSNSFVGNQIVTGSLTITENLTVLGSSSIVYSTASQLIVEDNVIVVNASFPAERFSGLEVHDSGSNGSVTASLLWDGLYNRWIYQNTSDAHYGGAMLISGPRNTGSLGTETTLTNGRIPKSIGGDHIGDSIINEISDSIGISGSLGVTGSLKVSNGISLPVDISIGFGNVSSIYHNSENGESSFRTIGADIYLGTVDSSIGIENDNAYISAYSSVNIVADASGQLGGEQLKLSNGFNTGLVVQPSGNITFATVSDDLVNKVQIQGSTYISSTLVIGKTTANAKLDVNGDVLVTGSITATGTVKGTNIAAIETATSSLNSFTSSINTTIKNKLNSDGVISGSSQISFGMISAIPSGLVSGSGQVLVGTTIHSGSFFNGITVVSGSAQISFNGITDKPTLVSGSSQITYGSLTGIPSGIVSGSSQITYGSITSIPSGIVSGSSQISFGSISSVPSGLVSGSSQVLNGTGIWSGSAQLPSGVVSGSVQTIANLPSGTVSGSSQISLTSTTGFGSYLNQAVLTTSTPTFSTVSATTFTGALSGNATTANSAGVLTASGGITTQYGSGTVGYSYALTNPQTGLFSAVDNSNSILTVNRHPGDYYSQLGFSSNGNLYYRNFSATAINTSQAWQTIWTSASLTNLNQLTNGPGYITGINSSNVTTALGFTPYNATNPNGYISSITSGNVTTALGYTPYNATNPNGYISSITSGNVTTALGYTPYNATNPNGYITSSATSLSLTGNLTVSSGNSTGGGIILADDGDIVDLNDAYLSLRFSSGVRIYSANRGGSAVITLGNTGVVTATTFSGALSGNATTATTAGALTSMNISQFTNNSGYLTSISSGNVTTALGYTPYNATNPNGYISGISFANVSSKPTTLSGYGITDAVFARTQGNWNSLGVIDNVVGLLAWKNYANGHVIFDASASTSPSGGSVNSTNSSVAWTATYPTLMGWNGTQTYGVRVDSARVADSATTAGSTSTLSSNAITNGYLVIGGNYSNDAHSSVNSTRLFFGGGNGDAEVNYYIGTNKENFGGNHAKLDLRWHTGIRMGAQSSYGGIRFYDSEDLGSVLFSIGTSDSNVRTHTNLLPSANNAYDLGSTSLGWRNVYTNDLHLSNMNKPEGNDIDGTNGTWTIQEGAENLYIINNRNNKKFKITLEEIL